jgi:hypothetical protein
MDIEQSPTYVALPEHVKPAWLRAIQAFPPVWLKLLQLVGSLKARRVVASACKAGVYSRTSGSSREVFGRMGLLTKNLSVSCMVLRLQIRAI